MTAVESLY